ncbi:hypothetical protein [Sphingopyxis sp. MWB1]|uniref:hypothetical protein n=1 Tax=Sphingopyxis sp. MWB1 TaxID=1537715 RepID=UPI00051A29AF|nr:hypothetical protein [Sphingopyxis sp. MWB1]
MARPNPEEPTLLERAIEEAKAMGRGGIDHPSTRPVLIGGVIGGLAGLAIEAVSWPIGLCAGAAIALYMRVKR